MAGAHGGSGIRWGSKSQIRANDRRREDSLGYIQPRLSKVDATSSDVPRRSERTVQARGHWFDPSCAYQEIRRALHISEGDEVEFAVHDDGTITVRGYVSIPTDQAWFFTPPPGP